MRNQDPPVLTLFTQRPLCPVKRNIHVSTKCHSEAKPASSWPPGRARLPPTLTLTPSLGPLCPPLHQPPGTPEHAHWPWAHRRLTCPPPPRAGVPTGTGVSREPEHRAGAGSGPALGGPAHPVLLSDARRRPSCSPRSRVPGRPGSLVRLACWARAQMGGGATDVSLLDVSLPLSL